MNLSLVEKVCYFFNSLGVVYDVQGPRADIQPPLEMAVHWISLVQHFKNWVVWVRSRVTITSVCRWCLETKGL